MTRFAPALETVIGNILAGGMILTTALLVGGLVTGMITTGGIGEFSPLPAKTLREFLLAVPGAAGSSGFSPEILIDAGIAVLLLTPYVSILAAVLFFQFREHNTKFAAISGFLFAVLTWILFFW